MKKTTPAKSLKLVILQSILRLEMRRKMGIAQNPKDLNARVSIANFHPKMPEKKFVFEFNMCF